MPKLILASGSPYRRTLLARLGLGFEVMVPDIDESAESSDDTGALAERLALLKARAIADSHRQSVVIGSDQVAECAGRQLGKPGTIENAVEQLGFVSGREVVFHTAVAVIANGEERCRSVPTRVQMRELVPRRIRAYVEADRPLDCAGAMKCESLGIALTRAISSDDPTALIGLPLIAVTDLLESSGIHVLDARGQFGPVE